MNITVFGANGRVGRIVVEMLATQGEVMTGFVHGEVKTPIEGVRYVQGDIKQAEDVAHALEDKTDVVVSCLGSWGTPTKDILSSAMHVIVPIMESRGIERIVSLTGADAWTEGDYAERSGRQLTLFGIHDGKPVIMQSVTHALFSLIASKIMRDSEAHIRTLSDSSLRWTVVRSPIMNGKGRQTFMLNGTYPWPWQTIHRRCVASAIVHEVMNNGHIRQAPYLHRT